MHDLRALPEWGAFNVCEVAAAMIGSSLIGAGGAVIAGNEAKKGAEAGADAQTQMFNTVRGDLMPYNTGGQGDFTTYNNLITGSPSQMQSSLEALPGYQFTRTQGLKAVQNSAAARGLGVSGAALKGAAAYGTGLADSTFGAQANRLLAGATLGENAAAQTGSTAGSLGPGIGNALTNAGAAQAAGITGATSNIGGGLLGYGMYGGNGGANASILAGYNPSAAQYTGIDATDPVYGVI